MPSSPDHLEPPREPDRLDEELVAYLDGELDQETGRQVETRIASDPQLRERLARLGRTWDLLDELARPEVDKKFTESTIEMIALAAEEEVRRRKEELPRRRRRRWTLAGGALLTAGLLGFLGAAMLRDRVNRQLLDDLPVLENFDEYQQIHDIEFLRELKKTGLFSEEPSDES